jgi:hypothetical protein
MVDEEGAIYYCPEYADTCTDYEVLDNIVGGAHLGGFYVYAHACGTASKTKGNVVHSVKGSGGVMFKDKNGGTC